MAALCTNESPDSVDAGLRLIRDADGLIASGGMILIRGDIEIRPSCCSGLEGWWEWRHFLQGGESPWMGHDPGGLAERVDDRVIIWSDGAMTPDRIGPSISVSEAEFETALALAEGRISTFFDALPIWLDAVGRPDAMDVVEKVRREFRINAGP